MFQRVVFGAALAAAPFVPAWACQAPCTGDAAYEVGDTLPAGDYYVLLNSEYYGLPPSDGAWRYYRVGARVLRVRSSTMEIVADATPEANSAF